jgi:hypothetical protein
MASGPSWAQVSLGGPATGPGASPGWYLEPSLALSGELNDNVFAASGSAKKGDFIFRATPGLTLGYRSQPLTLLGNYSFDAETYAKNTDLNNVGDNQQGGLQFQYRPDLRLMLGLQGSYSQTVNTTRLLQPTVSAGGIPSVQGVSSGREQTKILTASPSVDYEVNPLTSVHTDYIYSRTEVTKGSTDESHQADAIVSRTLTALDTGSLQYRFVFFESNQASSITTNAVLLGWTHRFTPIMVLTLAAGPRVSQGNWDAEANATFQYTFQQGSVSLGYERTESLVAGQTGPSTTDAVILSAQYQLLRALKLQASGSAQLLSAIQTSTATGQVTPNGDITVYTATAAAIYQFTEWLTATLTYTFSDQEQKNTPSIVTNSVILSFTFTYPFRVY